MNIALVGSGSWGTAVAGLAAEKAASVRMWAHSSSVATGINEQHENPRYLTDYLLPENVSATTDMAEALEAADGVIVAVPSAHVRAVARTMALTLGPAVPVLCLTKGIERTTGFLMSEVIADEIGHPERIAALSGPNHAEEVCRGSLSAAVIASEEPRISEFFKQLLISPAFRVYRSTDMMGVEICGAVKNIIAITCGIAVGVGYGDNTLALIMTRGLAEISRIVHARGGEPMTCMGLAGMGDLVATCTSPHSRNRTFGIEFAHGTTLAEYQDRTHMVVEGAAAAVSVNELAKSLGVDAPITAVLNDVLWNGASLDDALNTLANRSPTEEFYGLY